jgi:hypothetical protein
MSALCRLALYRCRANYGRSLPLRSIGSHYAVSESTINERGLDFLADDAGLTAILGVVTVRLHADTIRDLIKAKIAEAAASEEEKGLFKRQLATLPATALEAATSQLVGIGLANLPNTIGWLRTLAGL